MKLEARKMVAFDLDDVLADFINPFMMICARLHNRPDLVGLRPSDWEWTNSNLTPEQISSAWDIVNSTDGFWENLPAEDGVDKALVKEVAIRTNTVFPTARAYAPGASVAFQSAMFLRRNFGIMFPTVVVGNSKGPLAAALKYDYFIDDRPKNCIEVKEARPECQVYLRDTSHNQSFGTLVGIPRIPSANEFCEIVLNDISKGE